MGVFVYSFPYCLAYHISAVGYVLYMYKVDTCMSMRVSLDM